MILNRIKKYRRENNLTQEELARLSNITLRHYQKIENCEVIPRLDTAHKISKALKKSLYDIFILD